MKSSKNLRLARVGCAVLVLSLLVLTVVPLKGSAAPPDHTRKLPITAFLNLIPSNFFTSWSDPASGNVLSFDAYGKRNTFNALNLGTTVAGGVSIRDLGDGTQKVSVTLHTSSAICWGFANNLQAFGYTPSQVQNHLGAASLGDGLTRLDYIEPAGPLGPPDLFSFVGVTTFSTAIMCDGQLRPGSGFPDGTPGFAQTTQTSVFHSGVPSGCPPETNANCFPAEKIQFKPTGN